MSGVPIESLPPELRRKALAALNKQPRTKPSRTEVKGAHLPLRCRTCGETIYPVTDGAMKKHTGRLEVVFE